jgi:hypothetical protein
MTTTGISVSRPRCHPPCHALWCQRRHKGCGSDFCSCWVVPERAAGLLDRGGGGGGVADRPHLGVPAVPALAVQWRGVGSSGCPGRPAAEGATRRSDPFGRVGGNRLMTPPPRPHSHFPTTYLTSATHPLNRAGFDGGWVRQLRRWWRLSFHGSCLRTRWAECGRSSCGSWPC